MGMEAILWPKCDSIGIYELDFALRFCLEKSKELTKVNAITYDVREKIGSAISHIRNYRRFIVVTEPLSVISSTAGRLLLKYVKNDSVVAPVYNESGNSCQLAQIPFPYFDIETFEEVSAIMETRGELVKTDEIDSSCFACSIDVLVANCDSKFTDIPMIACNKYIHTGALVHKFSNVFSSERSDLAGLIPEDAQVILDVGCAAGGFGKALMKKRCDVVIDGVEMNEKLALEAEKVYRRVYLGRFEEVEISCGVYDAVNMGDVLEHMYDPWAAIGKVRSILKCNGVLVGCVPNVAHWSIIRQLLSGQFEYIPVGLLCVSHIRFFTAQSLRKLFESHGFNVEVLEPREHPVTPSAQRFLEQMESIGLSKDQVANMLAAEIYFKVRKL